MMAQKRARFEGEAFTIEHRGMTATVEGLSGWRDADGEIVFDAESAQRYAAEGDALVLRDRERSRTELRRIREKLGLTQADAARLTGGGHNAFSRYERGEATPLPAVRNLFQLLDNHPDLLNELAAFKMPQVRTIDIPALEIRNPMRAIETRTLKKAASASRRRPKETAKRKRG